LLRSDGNITDQHSLSSQCLGGHDHQRAADAHHLKPLNSHVQLWLEFRLVKAETERAQHGSKGLQNHNTRYVTNKHSHRTASHGIAIIYRFRNSLAAGKRRWR
jgi:hypothetical protein